MENFLGVIASLAPPLLHGDIVDDTTTLDDIFKLIRTYYQFAPSEATFLKFSYIKRETVNGSVERPVHLYLRMRQFIRDNLLVSSGKISHDGVVPTTNEKLTPTLERLVVLRWLELLHPKLPEHVGKVFSNELRTKSLKDLQPQILEQVDDLLRQIEQDAEENNVTLLRTNLNFNQSGNYGNRDRYGSNRHWYKKRGDDEQERRFHDRKNDAMRSEGQKVMICCACKAAGEPFIGHSIDSCANIAEPDRESLRKALGPEGASAS